MSIYSDKLAHRSLSMHKCAPVKIRLLTFQARHLIQTMKCEMQLTDTDSSLNSMLLDIRGNPLGYVFTIGFPTKNSGQKSVIYQLLIVCNSSHDLNNRPFNDQTTFDHSNTVTI